MQYVLCYLTRPIVVANKTVPAGSPVYVQEPRGVKVNVWTLSGNLELQTTDIAEEVPTYGENNIPSTDLEPGGARRRATGSAACGDR